MIAERRANEPANTSAQMPTLWTSLSISSSITSIEVVCKAQRISISSSMPLVPLGLWHGRCFALFTFAFALALLCGPTSWTRRCAGCVGTWLLVLHLGASLSCQWGKIRGDGWVTPQSQEVLAQWKLAIFRLSNTWWMQLCHKASTGAMRAYCNQVVAHAEAPAARNRSKQCAVRTSWAVQTWKTLHVLSLYLRTVAHLMSGPPTSCWAIMGYRHEPSSPLLKSSYVSNQLV